MFANIFHVVIIFGKFMIIPYLCLALTESALGSDSANQDKEYRFTFGDNCAELEDLLREDLSEMVKLRNAEYFNEFCYTEIPFECSDYSDLFLGLGYLFTDWGTRYCRFVPMQDLDGSRLEPDYGLYETDNGQRALYELEN